MNTLIVYASIHQGNTERIAQEMGSVLEAEVKQFSEVTPKDIESAHLVGFGSGIYFAEFHKGLINLVKGLPEMEDKRVFLFSTSGMKADNILNRSRNKFTKLLKKKKFKTLGHFNCPGYDNYSALKLIGGINKNRPNQKDLEKARKFAESMKSYDHQN